MVSCRVTGSQVWLVPGAQLRSARAGKCADDLHSGGGNGNVIDMFGCNGTGSQSWTVEPDFTLRMFGSKCLTDPGKLGTPGVKIALWSCAKGDKGQKVIVVAKALAALGHDQRRLRGDPEHDRRRHIATRRRHVHPWRSARPVGHLVSNIADWRIG